MALYEYLCADSNGNQKRGTMEAADVSDLKGALAMKGLLIISWRLFGAPPEPAKAAPKASPVEAAPVPEKAPVPKEETPAPEKLGVASEKDSEDSLRKFYSEKDLTLFQKCTAFLRTPLGLTILALLLVVAGGADYYFLSHVNPFINKKEDPNSMLSKIRSIHPGMERQDIESFLQREGGLHPSSNTRYIIGPAISVTINYDASSGEWSPHNRVIGTPHFETHVGENRSVPS